MSRAQTAPAMQQALRDLRAVWERTASNWRDEARRGFERDHFDPLVKDCEDAVRGVAELEQILTRLTHECSDREQ